MKVAKRELMRRGVSQHTLEKICSRKPVRVAKLATCLKVAEISARGLRRTTKATVLDRKTIRRILNRKKVKASTLAKMIMLLKQHELPAAAPP